MAIDVKALIENATLELCEEKHLSKISINDIQKSPASAARLSTTIFVIKMI